jgi:hypothetical protein
MQQKNNQYDILAILVLYKMNLNDSVSFHSLLVSLKKATLRILFLVYDNSPSCEKEPSKIWENADGIIYKSNPMNPGLAVAYNYGANVANEMNIEWLLLLDQDTDFEKTYFNELQGYIGKYPKIHLFAPILRLPDNTIFSPTRYKHKRGYTIKHITPGINNLLKILPVNSGMVIRTKKYIEAGGCNTNLKIDFIDFQFLEKFRRIDNKFCVLNTFGCQAFSNTSDNKQRQLIRFKIYLKDARTIEKRTIIDRVLYFYTVFRHTTSLTLRFRTFEFLKMFIFNYF